MQKSLHLPSHQSSIIPSISSLFSTIIIMSTFSSTRSRLQQGLCGNWVFDIVSSLLLSNITIIHSTPRSDLIHCDRMYLMAPLIPLSILILSQDRTFQRRPSRGGLRALSRYHQEPPPNRQDVKSRFSGKDQYRPIEQ